MKRKQDLFADDDDDSSASSSASSSSSSSSSSASVSSRDHASADEEFFKGGDKDDDANDDDIDEPVAATSIAQLKERIDETVAVLSDFKQRRKPGVRRRAYVAQLSLDMQDYYGASAFYVELALALFPVAEAIEFMEANERARPVTLRVNALKARRRDVAAQLIQRGANVDPVPWSAEGLVAYESVVPLGATPEYLAGHYMLQAAASWLPVMALAAQPGQKLLDMCAAPGGKASHVAAAMQNAGVLYVNDVNRERLAAVRGNLARLGVRNAIVTCYDGRVFPAGCTGGFDGVLVDAPCTGTGVASRDASVKSEKTADDVAACAVLQKALLLAAIDSTKVGGHIVYATCSITVDENEAVVDYALRRRAGCVGVVQNVRASLLGDVGVPGFTNFQGAHFHASLAHAVRVYPHTHNLDGFFICKLLKKKNFVEKKPEGEEATTTATTVVKKANKKKKKKKVARKTKAKKRSKKE